MDFGRPNAEISRKMANGQLLFLVLCTYTEYVDCTAYCKTILLSEPLIKQPSSSFSGGSRRVSVVSTETPF